ncbi:hypothetical protein ASF04_04235 [Duganella sp. Leaf61]|uniref:hypothetical protein n=1 Tax=Duganella sp. Leaf61 TaxID=1736227 RepID=UPI0006FA88D0|nr:hypothetical protein [Duganella sp. Leaf61]KQN75302.1 hypothetical protein ASF04_04235 [Duganella sp. Leaf61]
MQLETVSNIEIAADGSLLVVGLESGVSQSYQYVYRAAAGVYWDDNVRAFKLDTKNDKRFAHWFAHVCKVLEEEMNVRLHLGNRTAWTNVPNDVRSEIELSHGRL